MNINIQNLSKIPILSNSIVSLVPLTFDQHYSEMLKVVSLDENKNIFAHTSLSPDPSGFKYWFSESIENSNYFPFATIDQTTNSIIGSTRFFKSAPEANTVEIGWTWISKPFQRTPINTNAKFLMLEYAFETLNINRVELKTSEGNIASQKAIARIGGTYEGTLRQRRPFDFEKNIPGDGVSYFSILSNEWPETKETLEELRV